MVSQQVVSLFFARENPVATQPAALASAMEIEKTFVFYTFHSREDIIYIPNLQQVKLQ
jgi:hypothetical protein